ncbi:MAG: GTPase domain-containing protein [Selenomonadaceae bacterium]|nr:GTPase domain-containing protein [Selenomonadaceae bacterium]
MRDYIQDFVQMRDQINEDSTSIRIVNAGIMNSGKSSLFNSLLDRYEFTVRDARETVAIKPIEWQPGVFLIDTPGLEANKGDDAEANRAYQRANMIVFVHKLEAGELHQSEINAINRLKSLFDDPKFFWRHFCMVFTARESRSGFEQIVQKSLSDVQKECGYSDFKVFIVSNTDYAEGTDPDDPIPELVEESEIPAFRKFLQDNFEIWRKESIIIKKIKINQARESILSQLRIERDQIYRNIERKKEQIQDQQSYFLGRLRDVFESTDEAWREYDREDDELIEIGNELEELKDKHSREVF